MHGVHGLLWVGAMNLASRTSVVRVAVTTGEIAPQVALPGVYAGDSPIAAAFSGISVAPDAGTLVVGFAATNYLLLIGRNGNADTVYLPVARRRGVPERLAEHVAAMNSELDVYTALSTLNALEPLSPGEVLAAHLDMTARAGATMPRGPGGPDPFTYKLYVTLVDLTQRRICVDLPVPFSGDGLPSVAARGDTLYVSDQDAANPEHPWLVRRLLIRDSRCTWRTSRVGPA